MFSDETGSSLSDEWANYIDNFSTWRSFVTLTYRRDSAPPSDSEVVRKNFLGLVAFANKHYYGSHYTRKVKHSYFSYAFAVEEHKDGILHAHFLVDMPLPYRNLILFWSRRFGYIDIRPVIDNKGASKYLSKYISKQGDIHMYSRGLDNPLRLPSIDTLYFYKYLDIFSERDKLLLLQNGSSDAKQVEPRQLFLNNDFYSFI